MVSLGFPQQRHLSSLALSLQVETSAQILVFDIKNLSKFSRTFQHFPDTPNEENRHDEKFRFVN